MYMEAILDKLKTSVRVNKKIDWKTWSLNEQKQLMEIYVTICKHKPDIFDLIYSYHGCDSWEDIFRDYDKQYLKDKTRGVEIAIEEIIERLEEEK